MKTKLQVLYDKIPQVRCPPGCTRCCGPVCVSREEASNLKLPETAQSTPITPCNDCGFKTETGCSVYEQRPLTCRLFGTGQYGTPMGCRVREQARLADGPLTLDQQFNWLVEYFDLMQDEGGNIQDDDAMFACHEHDKREIFRTDEDLGPELLKRYLKWKQKKEQA